MMPREQCLSILAAHRGDAIVVAAYMAAFEWMRLSSNPLDYFAVGAMGQASSHGLGFALGCPGRKVLVLDGDGSLLMNLGSLVTIGAAAPDNLLHFVCRNGVYEANGAHPIPGADQVDFGMMAKAAGYRHAFDFGEPDAFAGAIDGILALCGPTLVTLRLAPAALAPMNYAALKDPERIARFVAALGEPAV